MTNVMVELSMSLDGYVTGPDVSPEEPMGRGGGVASRIVLACAQGRPNTAVAAEPGCDRVTVAKWRHRFAADRLEGLADAPRPGAVRTIGDDVVQAIVVETLETAPVDATHWSTRALAARHGISRQTVSEIWRAFGLKPWRQDEFKVSPDPDLVEKIRDIVGPYLNPPVAAAVFAVDEKPQIQALDRSAPILPMLPTTPQRATHDNERNGTIDLFAALEVATGKVITQLRPSHQRGVRRVLEQDQPRGPRRPRCPVVLDNLSPTRPRPCTSGCCGTSGSTSTSPRPTDRG